MDNTFNLTTVVKPTKKQFKLYGRITMEYYEEYDVYVPYFDLKMIEDNEKPIGYKKLGEYCVFSDHFSVYSWVDDNNVILDTIVCENSKNTPNLYKGATSYCWECFYENGKWRIVDYNEQPYIIG